MAKAKTIKKINQYVIPLGKGWAVKGEGNINFTFFSDTKQGALSYARDIAVHRSADLIIYGRDGRIAERNSYAKKQKGVVKK